MTNHLKTNAFILATRKWSDNSLIVTTLTREFGIFKLIAKGALKTKSPFRGKLELFNQVDMVYSDKHTRKLQVLTEVHVLNVYRSIRENKIGVTVLFIMSELLHLLMNEQENADLFFKHLVRLLDWMNLHTEHLQPALINFIAANLSFSGYGFHYECCQDCGQIDLSDQVGFIPQNGNYICSSCISNNRIYSELIPSDIIMLFRRVTPFKNLVCFYPEIPKPVWTQFFPLLEKYLSFHLERSVQLKSPALFLQLL